MHRLQWRSESAIGHPVIDNQHMALIELIRALRTVPAGDGRSAAVAAAIADLVDYVEIHFQTEEAFMAERAPAELPSHQLEHADLRERTADILGRSDVESGSLCSELADMLDTWFSEHVTLVDGRLRAYV